MVIHPEKILRPRMRLRFLYVIFSVIFSSCCGTLVTRVVRTKYGDITGTIMTLSRHLEAVEVYKGVPYAAPPVGNLRFMPPVSGARWSGARMADKFAPVCPQNLPDISNETLALKRMSRGRLEFLKRLMPFLQNQSEDCLYLNIYAPTQEGDEIKKYPVLVFIHGESYEWNSGNPYDGSVLATFAGLVVVTINYRLGILGFLNTNSDSNQKVPSNYGLMDQIAALHWLQENVAFFGGDPTNVTLVGHGTGASCVNFLMSSTAVPEGLLFHRVILMSGSSLSPWALVREPSLYAKQVADAVNCSFHLPHHALLKCLREKPFRVLTNISIQVADFNTAFGPNVDGVIIDIVLSDNKKPFFTDITHNGDTSDSSVSASAPGSGASGGEDADSKNTKWPISNMPTPVGDYASTILNNPATKQKLISKYSRYDMMTGVVKAESFFIFSNDDVQYGIEPDRRSKILKMFVKNTYRYHLSEILATIVNEYTEWEKPIQHPVSTREETLEAFSDAQYVASVTQTADLHSISRRNSYFYVFEYQSKNSYYPPKTGCVHGEELPYLFGAPLVNGGLEHFSKNYTKADTTVSETFMLYISNFARTGNPNEPGPANRSRLKNNFHWTPYETTHKKYLSLDTKLKLKDHYRAHKLSFWLYLIPELHKPGSDDVPPSHHQFPPEEIMYPQQSYKVSNATPAMRNESFNATYDLPVVMVASSSSDRNAMTQIDDNVVRDEQLISKDNNNNNHSPNNDDRNNANNEFLTNQSVALISTIVIGCILLTLNVLVFAFIYRKRNNERSISDKNSGSIRSLSSNNSLMLGVEAGNQITKRVTENGGPSLNLRKNTDSIDRTRQYTGDTSTKSHPSIVDQSLMFVLEPVEQTEYEYELKLCHDPSDTAAKYSHCATLPKLPRATVCTNSNQLSPSYWPSKLNAPRNVHRDACELGLGTLPRQPKSILKNHSVCAEHPSKSCTEDCNRIRV